MTENIIRNYGFDIDGCVLDWTSVFLSKLATKGYGHLCIKDITSFFIGELNLAPSNVIQDCMDATLSDTKSMRPYYGAFRFLRKYYSMTGERLNFVTGRDEDLRDVTEARLDHGLSGDVPFKVYFTQDKGKVLQERSIDCYVEDAFHIAKRLSSIGINVLLMNREWNKESIDTHSILRVDSWDSIDRIVFPRRG